jgi:hypothetical protein
MKYRVTLTFDSLTHPYGWIEDVMDEALYEKGERLIDVGIVELGVDKDG